MEIVDIIKSHYPNSNVEHASFENDTLITKLNGEIRLYKLVDNEILVFYPKKINVGKEKLISIFREAKINTIIKDEK